MFFTALMVLCMLAYASAARAIGGWVGFGLFLFFAAFQTVTISAFIAYQTGV